MAPRRPSSSRRPTGNRPRPSAPAAPGRSGSGATRRPAAATGGRRPAAASNAQRPLRAPGTGIGANGSYRPSGGFATWSTRRKARLARTVGIVFLVVLVLWRCTGGDDGEVATDDTPRSTTTAVTTTTVPVPATTVTAEVVDGRLPAARSLAGGAPLGRRVLIAAGLDDARNSTTDLWTFDPKTRRTEELGALAEPLHAAAMARFNDQTVLMGGGKGTSVYDSVQRVDASGTVTGVGRLPTPRTNAVAVTDPSSGILLLGGYDGRAPTNEVVQTVDGSTFMTVATLLHPTRFPAAALLGRSIWVIGGEYDKTLSAGIQRVDLDSGAVVDVAPLPVALSRASAFTLGGSIFVAGGRTADGRSDQIYRIDPMTGAVAVAGVLPEPRSDATVVVSGARAYLFGGLSPKPTDSVVEITANRP